MLWLLLDRYNPSIQGILSRLIMSGGNGLKEREKKKNTLSAIFWYRTE